jgi:hypothetical protein
MLVDLAERFADTRQDAQIVQNAIDKLVDGGMSEEQAGIEVAADLHMAQQRNLVLDRLKVGQSVPEGVSEIARVMGYQPKPQAPAAAPVAAIAAPQKPGQTAAETIRATARASAAGKSLSQLSPAGVAVPDGPAIRTVQDWMALHKSNPEAARNYARQMSARDPTWHTKLASR